LICCALKRAFRAFRSDFGHYARFVEEIERSGGHLPRFVHQEFEDYLRCGLLEHEVLRVKCDGCLHGATGRNRIVTVTPIQRFGSDLNPHPHRLFLDVDYPLSGNRPNFYRARYPTVKQLNDLLDTLNRRIMRGFSLRLIISSGRSENQSPLKIRLEELPLPEA
jgi:hypothetical protein